MSKYVFKNPEVEKALRLVANELGVDNESFDKQIEEWWLVDMVYMDDGNRDVLCFPTDLIEEVKEFNLYGWNDSDVIPPKDEDDPGTSKIMLIENDDNFPYKGYFNFELNCWCELGTCEEIECLRYRIYPTD